MGVRCHYEVRVRHRADIIDSIIDHASKYHDAPDAVDKDRDQICRTPEARV